ncbi:hypothetical protein A3C23_01775 [Candidatus Roizmanbacteria bacterium RIFCSPHIGHO2_02_FULL_37_13b]|uniref:Nucleotidyl transferase domain-containing protein n=1 Tax=Candidatus Roizmanbacteria bacterium RIFCSPLOWO2_02_FULL_36_11 TaxID=1802071 RepID=A0A1F7JCZ1_9BACT|nr:MAG: hypothetical protein A3C23_01775 [Candidatus Roizmanbacteria bacterium RIFCSPHIGHO2_02_FULL_37_13b]OGK53465.1 MAG: hypothetical protein A3H78_02935 [Candidatus Roizmanbacteria bacterium RIFCSPLOWO2_02_FULL_36_11]
MKAIIVAGGRGERLRPLTDKIPKPLIKIGNKSLIEHSIDLLKTNGIIDITILLCYLPEKIVEALGDGKKLGVRINYLYEDPKKPLGTAGNIYKAREFLDRTFIVTYADIIRQLDLKKMIKNHKKNKAIATIHTYKRHGPNPKSMIMFDKNGCIERFVERPFLKLDARFPDSVGLLPSPSRTAGLRTSQFAIKRTSSLTHSYVWANGSFYIFEPEIFDYIPKNKPCDFAKDVFPSLLKNKKRLFAFPYSKFFIDVGTHEKLKKARKTSFGV